MPSPKPVVLTQIPADEYDGVDPQPLVVVGSVPGGGGGGPIAIGDVTGLTAALASKAGAAEAEAALDALSDVVATKASAADLDNTFAIATSAIPSSQKAAVNGVATLGADGKLPVAQLPPLAVTEFLGTAANQAAMLALVGQQGDWTTRTDRGTVFIITGADPTQLSSWQEMSYPTAPVLSVNGKTGIAVLSPADVGAATAAQGAKADSSVQLTGDQTIAGIKTFSSAPVVPVGSFAINRTTGLQAALDAKVPTATTVAGYALTANVPRAGLNTRGVGEALFIPNGGTVPGGTPAYTIIIEAAA